MDNENHKSRTGRFWHWFKRKDKRSDPFYLGEVTGFDYKSYSFFLSFVHCIHIDMFINVFLTRIADWGDDEDDDYLDDFSVRSTDDDSCLLTNELR